MYAIFGSCKDITIGPTAIMSIMTAEHAAAGGITYVILITFLTGCIQLTMGILNLGNFVHFKCMFYFLLIICCFYIECTEMPDIPSSSGILWNYVYHWKNYRKNTI